MLARFFKRRVGGMLVRNTLVSTGVFAIGLGVLWLMVERARVGDEALFELDGLVEGVAGEHEVVEVLGRPEEPPARVADVPAVVYPLDSAFDRR